MEEMINGAKMVCSEEMKMNDNLYDYFWNERIWLGGAMVERVQ